MLSCVQIFLSLFMPLIDIVLDLSVNVLDWIQVNAFPGPSLEALRLPGPYWRYMMHSRFTDDFTYSYYHVHL